MAIFLDILGMLKSQIWSLCISLLYSISMQHMIFVPLVPPRGGNEQHCVTSQWLNYSYT